MSLVKSPERLDSWKEIAQYLGRDERTVQRWETDCALPVHRTPGRRRGSVFAYPHELDAWLAGRNEVPPVPMSAPVTAAAPTPRTEKPRYLHFGLGLLLAAVIVAAGFVWRGPRQFQSALRLTLVEDRVIGMDQQGQKVWEYRLREPSPWPADPSTAWRHIEVAGKPAFVVIASHKTSGGGELDCLSADGTLLWRYEPKMTLNFGSQTDDGPWAITDFDVANESPKPRLWAAVGDSIWGHSFISEIDALTGTPQVRFVNNGAIYAVRILQKDAHSYVLAGGFNNEYDLPMLAVLDASQSYAASPQTPGTRYYCVNCTQGTPLKYFILPRSELNLRISRTPNSVFFINLSGNTLQVSTRELSEGSRAIYFFSVTPDISPQSVTLASTYWAEHRELERERKIDHPAERCVDYLKPKPIRMWASGKWSELAVDYTPKGGIPEK